MKKIISVLLSFILVLSISASGFAASAAQILEFTDVDNVVHTNANENGTVVVFGRPGCGNTQATLNDIKNSNAFKNNKVKVIFADIDSNSRETISQFRDTMNTDSIEFCYGSYNSVMWDLYHNVYGYTGSVTLPVVAVFDGNANLIKVETGVNTANNILKLLNMEAEIDYTKEPYTLYFSRIADYDFALEVARLVNEERAKEGLAPLDVNNSLFTAAMQRSVELSVYYDHIRPDGTQCFTAFPQHYSLGENIALGYSSPSAVVNAWMNSPNHRENIMSPDFNSIGVGCAVDEKGTCYWTQVFSSADGEAGVPTGKKEDIYQVSVNNDYTQLEIICSPEEFVYEDIGKSFLLSVMCYDSYVGIKTTVLPESFDYSSSDTAVAQINSYGVLKIVGTGTFTVTVCPKDNQARTIEKTFTVKEKEITHSHNFVFSEYVIIEEGVIAAEYICDSCDSVVSEDKGLLGDVELNGSVTAADARLALRASVGLESIEPGELAFVAADADKNGNITAADARIILRVSVGLEQLK